LCKAAGDPASTAPGAGLKPTIALLLPLDSPDYSAPADAVLQGCRAALALAEGEPQPDVMRTDASPASIAAQYEAAVQRGATVVVGPMTRSGVSALAAGGKVRVLTLALNVPDGNEALPANLYALGLSVESEARQVARAAYAEKLRDAVVVHADSALARRSGQAFSQAWLALGGKISDTQEFGPRTELVRLHQRLSRSNADLVFLAAGPEQARTVRPYLNNQIPVFATSQINSGRADPAANVDLNGVRFVEMPWLAQPDNINVMVFRRAETLAPELQRFYALGIDACRIAANFLHRRLRVSLEGVTGNLSMTDSGHIEREAIQAVFRDGAGVALGTP